MTNGITIRNSQEEKKITKIPETLSAPNFRILDLSASLLFRLLPRAPQQRQEDVWLAVFTVLLGMRLGRCVSSRGVICWQAQRRILQAEVQWQQLKAHRTKSTHPSAAKAKIPSAGSIATDKWFGECAVPKMRFRCYSLDPNKSIPLLSKGPLRQHLNLMAIRGWIQRCSSLSAD